MRETSLLVDFLSVTMDMMRKMPLWFAGLQTNKETWNLFPIVALFSAQNQKRNLPRMLGYSFGQTTRESHFGSVSSTFKMDNVQCTGNEASLLDCPHLTVDDCGSHEGAGVICSNSGRLYPEQRHLRFKTFTK